MLELVNLVDVVYRVLNLLIFVRIILTWIPGMNMGHPVVRLVHQITAPIIEPIRRLMPPTGGFDLSPMVAVMLLYLARNLLVDVLLAL
ncbi:MAG: YggT family protein [Armatimonadota bacterium]